MSSCPRILFCNCTYAQVVPKEVKEAVLQGLCDAGAEFEGVADLCEMAARRDPTLQRLAQGPVKIAACYPRAVKWLMAAGGAPLNPAQAEVLNMRVQTAAEVLDRINKETLEPNLPSGIPAPPPAAEQVPASMPTI